MNTEHSELLAASNLGDVSDELRLDLYRVMLLQRTFEERIVALYRQGQIAGNVYTGRGQEAVAAGAGLALGPTDVVAPLNRELGCHFARGVSPTHVFENFLGKATGPTHGRDGNMHFGVGDHNIFPLVSMLGNLLPVVVGAALAFKQRGEPRVAMTFLGEGAFSVGDVHEGLNLAGVWRAPVVIVIQSNQFSYSTPSAAQMVNTVIAERLQGGWSVPCERIDGTDAVAVYAAARNAVALARGGEGPQAIETVSLRVDGHAAHDAATYADPMARDEYVLRRDPIRRMRMRLELDGIREQELENLEAHIASEIATALQEAQAADDPQPGTLLDDVYASP